MIKDSKNLIDPVARRMLILLLADITKFSDVIVSNDRDSSLPNQGTRLPTGGKYKLPCRLILDQHV